jgi:hypothetical protein
MHDLPNDLQVDARTYSWLNMRKYLETSHTRAEEPFRQKNGYVRRWVYGHVTLKRRGS